jgi:hypothetical protein
MNDLFRSSWIKNTQVVMENAIYSENLINEGISKIIGDVSKKMAAAGIGIPYRDDRLFFYEFLKDKHNDKIPQDFKDAFATIKPQGKDINALMGKILMDEKLPEGFVDKLSDDFDKYSKTVKKIGDKEIDAVTEFLNRAAGSRESRGVRAGEEPKKKFGDISAIKAAVETGGRPEQALKKGANAFETLNLNLSPEDTLVFDEESAMGYGIYTLTKNGLKYRVTLKQHDGNPKKVSGLSKDNLVSLVITKPSEKERFAGPTIDDMETPQFEREKSVADYPAEKGDDFSTPDPEDIAYGKQYEIDDDENEEDEKEKEEDYEQAEEDINEEDAEDMMKDKTASKAQQRDTKEEDSEEQVKMSPQQVNAMLARQHYLRMQNRFNIERRHTLGY